MSDTGMEMHLGGAAPVALDVPTTHSAEPFEGGERGEGSGGGGAPNEPGLVVPTPGSGLQSVAELANESGAISASFDPSGSKRNGERAMRSIFPKPIATEDNGPVSAKPEGVSVGFPIVCPKCHHSFTVKTSVPESGPAADQPVKVESGCPKCGNLCSEHRSPHNPGGPGAKKRSGPPAGPPKGLTDGAAAGG